MANNKKINSDAKTLIEILLQKALPLVFQSTANHKSAGFKTDEKFTDAFFSFFVLRTVDLVNSNT